MWKPGQSGNPAGNPKIKRFLAAVDRAILQDDGKRLRQAAETLLDKAAEGEQWAIAMLADRLDGKPAQVIQGDEDAPLVVREIAIKLVEAAKVLPVDTGSPK